jgi:hypothetical protein
MHQMELGAAIGRIQVAIQRDAPLENFGESLLLSLRNFERPLACD